MTTPAALTEFAPAKVNLTLEVLGRRADGYHELESLVAFADVGDRLTLVPSRTLGVSMTGPTAALAGPAENNLVLKAARALGERIPGLQFGQFRLVKRLPVAAGIGGGSSDAAAALRLLARFNRLPLDDARLMQAARATGADVPVCLAPRARMMRGIGERLSEPLDLPPLAAVLVNPRIAVATADVFRALKASERSPAADAGPRKDRTALQAYVARHCNDLEAPALVMQPMIGEVLGALQALPGCQLARMSGSGATCFALFSGRRAARAAANSLSKAEPAWWVRATTLR